MAGRSATGVSPAGAKIMMNALEMLCMASISPCRAEQDRKKNEPKKMREWPIKPSRGRLLTWYLLICSCPVSSDPLGIVGLGVEKRRGGFSWAEARGE